MIASSSRHGFTLVELLVVTGLMAGLLGLALTIGRPSGNAQVGQLLQLTSSAVLATQTRALGKDQGAALLLEPVTGGLPVVACGAMFSADIPPFMIASGSVGMPPASLSATSGTVTFGSVDNAAPSDLQQGYRIRLSGTTPGALKSAWFGFASAGALTSGTVSFRSAANQTSDNTIWPRGTITASGTAWRAEIACYPRKANPVVEPMKLAAIDLRYSGVGDTGVGEYAAFATASNNKGMIAVCFDGRGRLESVMQLGSTTVQPISPTSPVYLLIATVADIQENRSLQSQSSRWLAIAPGTGRVSIAANVPVSGITPGELAAARANVRLGVTQGVGR